MDPISDMFNQITNAKKSDNEKIVVPFSKVKMAILEMLKINGKIKDYQKITDKKFQNIEVILGNSQLSQIIRISKPSKRVYRANGSIPRPKSPQGFIIMTTSEGIMLGEEANKKGLGGEVICEVI